jgi:biofilm protein TabA
MIVTDLDKAAEQIPQSAGLKKAIDWLKSVRGQILPDGRVDIDGDKVYALCQSYETKGGEMVFEGHRKYIDVQYVAQGAEIIYWTYSEQATVTRPYEDAGDYWLGTMPIDMWTGVRLTSGQLAVLFPTDAHAPCRMAQKPMQVKKIVIKVAVGS